MRAKNKAIHWSIFWIGSARTDMRRSPRVAGTTLWFLVKSALTSLANQTVRDAEHRERP